MLSIWMTVDLGMETLTVRRLGARWKVVQMALVRILESQGKYVVKDVVLTRAETMRYYSGSVGMDRKSTYQLPSLGDEGEVDGEIARAFD
jgi:hypothetical protein